ncbi:response regulator transcription factor [Clostridium senegalense]|uniref:response regulator transcription factor n=1 Tax=Clostridium senegalense TaxID=1465809 RepID=UPI00028881A6|nr:response regulator transcription factor [Clostridium senegalense]
MFKILIVEDDLDLSNQLTIHLNKWGHNSKAVGNFQNILPEFKAFNPNLILLDVNLPFYDGFYWCNEIRKISKVPIIIISSRDSNMDIIMGVNFGADDYISKPFSFDVLLAKVNAILRRSYNFTSDSNDILVHNDVTLDLTQGIVYYNDQSIELTKNELKIISILMKYNKQIVSRDKIMEKLWDSSCFVDDNTLTVNVNRLRGKLKELGLENFIETKRGIGYIIS